MKHVAVVTVSFNSHDETRAFLKSLETVKRHGFTLETIVVDNGSKEHFMFRGLRHPERSEGSHRGGDSSPAERVQNDKTTKLIRLNQNTGFTGGYNRGMSEALQHGADYVLAVNNDTILDPLAIGELIKVLELDEKIGVAVPKIYFAKGHEFHKERYKKEELGKVFWYAGGYMDWDNVRSVHRGVDEVDEGQYEITEETTFATGCCLFIKREVLEKVGMFDERFFLYYEDADFTQRVQKAGYSLYYAPKAIVHHMNASSSGGAGNTLQDYFLTRNQMLFGMRYAPAKTKTALLRQSIRFLLRGRPMQKLGVKDFYQRKFGKGTFFEKR